MRELKTKFVIRFFVYFLLIVLIGCQSTQLPKMQNPEQAEIAGAVEQKAWERGKEIYFDSQLGTNGLSCESCHPKGDMTNAEAYPRYKHVLGTMATLSMTHNFAVVNESRGKPWELGSDDANALALYVSSLANGKKIRMAWPKEFKNDWIKRGKLAFENPALGSNQKSCQSCHFNGSQKDTHSETIQVQNLKGVAAYYPRYSFQHQRVITLEQRINYCIEKYLMGHPLALDDKTIVALCCYVTSLSEGKKIAVAK